MQVNVRSSTPRTEATAVEYPQQHRHQVPQAPSSTAPSAFLPPYSQPQPNSWVSPAMSQGIQGPLGPPPAPLLPSNVAPPSQAPPPSARVDEWDSTFLNTLGQNDHKQLRDLLTRTPPDVVLPVGQTSPLSQTVILALIHRVRCCQLHASRSRSCSNPGSSSQLGLSLTELSPADDAFKTTLWWLQRSAYSLNPNDNVIGETAYRRSNSLPESSTRSPFHSAVHWSCLADRSEHTQHHCPASERPPRWAFSCRDVQHGGSDPADSVQLDDLRTANPGAFERIPLPI